jgi:hypothetical protein
MCTPTRSAALIYLLAIVYVVGLPGCAPSLDEGDAADPLALSTAAVQSDVYASTETLLGGTVAAYRDALVVRQSSGGAVPEPDNAPPVADAGDDINVAVHTLVTLDASGSSDPDDDRFAFEWQFVSGPGVVAIDTPSAPQLEFVARDLGTYRFRLHVTDAAGAQDWDEVVVASHAFAFLEGGWVGSRRNPNNGHTSHFEVRFESGALSSFEGRFQHNERSEWFMAGLALTALPDEPEERVRWELILGDLDEFELGEGVLIVFSPTEKIRGNFVTGQFYAYVAHGRLIGAHFPYGLQTQLLEASRVYRDPD